MMKVLLLLLQITIIIQRKITIVSSFVHNNNQCNTEKLSVTTTTRRRSSRNNCHNSLQLLLQQRRRQRHLRCIVVESNINRWNSKLFSNRYENNYNDEIIVQEYLATCIPGLSNVLMEELENLGAANIEEKSNSAVIFTSSKNEPYVGLKALLWCRTCHRIMELLYTSTTSSIDDYGYYGDYDGGDDVDIRTRDDLYNVIRNNIDVKDLLGNGRGGLLTLSVKMIYNGNIPKDLSHSHYTALTIKNALVDKVRDLHPTGDRPSVDIDNPDVPLVGILYRKNPGGNFGNNNNYNNNNNNNNKASGNGGSVDLSLYRQLHIGSLHKRGYRKGYTIHKASMKESLAAGLLLSAGWWQQQKQQQQQQQLASEENLQEEEEYDSNSNKKRKGTITRLIDPMCGSGSLILEGLMICCNIAPGLMRIKCGVEGSSVPPVVRWKSSTSNDNVKDVWKELLLDATKDAKIGLQNIKTLKQQNQIQFIANDVSDGPLDILEQSLNVAGFNGLVDIYQFNCRDLGAEFSLNSSENTGGGNIVNTWIVTNPPWGVRLSDDDHESWESLRTFLRDNDSILPLSPPSSTDDDSCGRTQAWILSGNKSTTKHLGLKRNKSIVVKTSNHDLRWIQYYLFNKDNNGINKQQKYKPKEGRLSDSGDDDHLVSSSSFQHDKRIDRRKAFVTSHQKKKKRTRKESLKGTGGNSNNEESTVDAWY